MLRNLLYHVAGIDRETLSTCPATDKMWAAHLGFSLALSFIVVLGITFHASGYVLADTWMRLLVATVVALTVFMFDRALYQSDWFYQGLLWSSPAGRGSDGRNGRWTSLRRFCRIAIRLSISFGLAWVIAVFLELAVFSDSITDKIKRDHVTVNRPIFQKIEQYEAQLNGEIEQRRQNLADLEKLYSLELTTAPAFPPSNDYGQQQLSTLDEQIGNLDTQEQRLRTELRDVEAKIAAHAEAMNAEELGQRISPDSSGRAGAGPRYQFARRQKEFFEARRTGLQNESSQLDARRESLRTQQRRLSEQGAAQRDQGRDAAQNRRDALRTQIEAARTELRTLEASRLANIEDFRRKALAASDFQKQKDDPLSRMTAYQELKNDPKDGATITLFSWMTKFLVIFLEIVPVVAKMFFSPPSVYAAKIQAEVARERKKAMLENEHVLVDQQSEEDRRRQDQKTRIDRQSEVGMSEEGKSPQPQDALADRQLLKETSTPASTAQPMTDAGPPERRERDTRVPASAAGLVGLIVAATGDRTKDVPGHSAPRSIAQPGDPAALASEQAAPKKGPEVEGPSFDAVDPQLQYDWDELMEVAERGDLGTTNESEELELDADERGPIQLRRSE